MKILNEVNRAKDLRENVQVKQMIKMIQERGNRPSATCITGIAE